MFGGGRVRDSGKVSKFFRRIFFFLTQGLRLTKTRTRLIAYSQQPMIKFTSRRLT